MGTLTGGIVGAGFFAQFHADGWRRIPGITIAAVADPDETRARAFADRWHIPKVYPDVDQMLEEQKLDFLDIATRPESHRQLVSTAAKKGVNALCQKPMAPCWDDCVEMVRICADAKIRLLMHENWRWQPWFREMKRVLDDGLLGTPFHVDFRMRTGDGRGPDPYPVQPYFRKMERLLVYETAVHYLDTFRFLLGEIRQVECRLKRINPAIRGEDYALIRVEFQSGADGMIDANRVSGPVPVPVTLGTSRMEGDRGMIRLDEQGGLHVAKYGEPETEHAFATPEQGYKGDSVKATNEHLAACLRDETPCESEGKEYLKTVALVEACYESSRTGKPVEPQKA